MVKKLLIGEDSNYLLEDEVGDLVSQLLKEFPNLISRESLGQSYENRSIDMLTLTLNHSSNSALLITAAHHSRELATVQMAFYSMLRILHGYIHGDIQIANLLQRHKLLVIPAVNIDGFTYISDVH